MNTLAEYHLMSSRERGRRFVRENKDVELAQCEIMSINDRSFSQLSYEYQR